MKIIISIINFNGKENTRNCLASIDSLNLKGIEVEVVVVDNASDEKITVEEKKYKNFSIKLIENSENVGFSGGHNISIKYALEHNAEYIVILNNDTVLDKNLLHELVAASEKNDSIGIVVPKIYFSKGSEFHKDRYEKKDLGKVIWYAGGKMNWENVIGYHRGVDEVDKGQFDHEEVTDFATGCCMMIRTGVFKKTGVLDTKYFLYYEDSDFSMRVKKEDYTIYYAPKAYLWHENASSSGGSGSQLQDYFISRNRLLFGFTYASHRTKVALTRESFRLLQKGRPWQKKGVRDFFLRKFGKGSYTV